MERRADQPLPLGVWLLGLAGIAALVAVAFSTWRWSVFDRDQQLGLVTALARGDIAHAFDDIFQTSGPGFGLFAQPVYRVARWSQTAREAYVTASVSALVPLAVASIAASRAVGVGRRSLRELALVAMIVLGVPTLACFSDSWHPSDVLATALCLGAFATQTQGRRGWTAVLLGTALATRQWAMLALAVALVLDEEEGRLRLLAGALATAVFLTLPFFVTDPKHVFDALAANDVAVADITVVGMAPLGPAGRLIVSRYLPLIIGAAVCLWLYRRRLRWDPHLAAGALATILLVRAAVDPAFAVYYLAPGAAFFTVMWRRSWWGPVAGFAAGLLLWWRLQVRFEYPSMDVVATAPDPSFTIGRIHAVLCTALLAAWVLAAWLQTRRVGLELADAAPEGDEAAIQEPV